MLISGSVPSTTLPNAESITADLTEHLPQWLLTCYSAFKYTPNIIEGDDLSFEEARWEYTKEMQATGRSDLYVF